MTNRKTVAPRPSRSHEPSNPLTIGRGIRRSGWREGKVRPLILLWVLGVPIPIILVILLIRGCMG